MASTRVQATYEDLLDLRTARIASGYLEHRGCGGRIVWSTFIDKAKCTLCDWSMQRPAIHEKDHGLYRKEDFQVDKVA